MKLEAFPFSAHFETIDISRQVVDALQLHNPYGPEGRFLRREDAKWLPMGSRRVSFGFGWKVRGPSPFPANGGSCKHYWR